MFSFRVLFFLHLTGLPLPNRLQRGVCENPEMITAFSDFSAAFKKAKIKPKLIAQIHVCTFQFCFSLSGQESCARQQGKHRNVQKWSMVAAAGDLAGVSHQDTKACYREGNKELENHAT